MKNGKSITVRKMAVIAMTAAIYATLTIGIPFGYGDIQCRIAEAMNLLVFFNPIFAPGIVLGCLIANIFSPLNILLDMTLGTFSTVCAVYCISKSKNMLIASIYPIIFSGFIVGLELLLTIGTLSDFSRVMSYIIYTAQVMAGQFVAMIVVAYPLFLVLTKKNQNFIKFLENI